MKSQTVKSQAYDEKHFKKILLAFVQKNPKGFKLSEAVLATGLSNDWVEFTLRQLLNEYKGRIELTEDHQLFYVFDLEGKSENIFKKIILWFGRKLWQLFQMIFKVWIVLMLCTYFLVNIVILALALTIILRSSKVMDMAFHSIKAQLKELSISNLYGELIKPVFAYVFGEPKAKKDTLATEKLILQQINANNGYLFTSDIIRLTGCDLAEAQSQAAQILANYQGEVSVNAQGLIQYYFPEQQKQNATDSPPAPIWQRLIPKEVLNQNDEDLNLKIMLVNAFNLLMSFLSPQIVYYYLIPDRLVWADIYANYQEPRTFFLFWVPMLFSCLFFLIPALRSINIDFQNRKIARLNKHYQILEQLFAQMHNPIIMEALSQRLEDVEEPQIQAVAIGLGATLELNEAGGRYWQMEDIAAEQELAEKLRAG